MLEDMEDDCVHTCVNALVEVWFEDCQDRNRQVVSNSEYEPGGGDDRLQEIRMHRTVRDLGNGHSNG